MPVASSVTCNVMYSRGMWRWHARIAAAVAGRDSEPAVTYTIRSRTYLTRRVAFTSIS